MVTKDTKNLYNIYSLIIEGRKDIAIKLEKYKGQPWVEVASTLLLSQRKDYPEITNWRGKEEPLLKDVEAFRIIEWFQNNELSLQDIKSFTKDVVYFKSQQAFNNFKLDKYKTYTDFINAVHADQAKKEKKKEFKAFEGLTEWPTKNIIFQNDDFIAFKAITGIDNSILRRVVANFFKTNYTFCIGAEDPAQNLYGTYRFANNPCTFYWLIFKKLSKENYDHVCVVGKYEYEKIKDSKKYPFHLTFANNSTTDYTWEDFVSKYKKYGIDFNSVIEGFDNNERPITFNAKNDIKFIDFQPEELAEKDLRDVVSRSSSSNKPLDTVIKELYSKYTTEDMVASLIGDMLPMTKITPEAWDECVDVTKQKIVNRSNGFLPESTVQHIYNKDNKSYSNTYARTLSRNRYFIKGRTLVEFLFNVQDGKYANELALNIWKREGYTGFICTPTHNLGLYTLAWTPSTLSKFIAIISESLLNPDQRESWKQRSEIKKSLLMYKLLQVYISKYNKYMQETNSVNEEEGIFDSEIINALDSVLKNAIGKDDSIVVDELRKVLLGVPAIGPKLIQTEQEFIKLPSLNLG